MGSAWCLYPGMRYRLTLNNFATTNLSDTRDDRIGGLLR